MVSRRRRLALASIPLVFLALAIVYLALVFSGRGWRLTGGVRHLASPADLRPEQPGLDMQIVHEIPLPGPPLEIKLTEDAGYISLAHAGFVVLDVSEPGRPLYANHITDPGGSFVLSVYPDGDRLYALDRIRGLVQYNLPDPLEPEQVFAKKLPGLPSDQPVAMIRIGDYYYLACGGGGVQVLPANFGILTPATPVLDYFNHPNDLTFYPPDLLVVSGGRNTTMQVLDVEDPSSPTLVANLHTPGFGEDVLRLENASAFYLRPNMIVSMEMERPTRPLLLNMHAMVSGDQKSNLVKSLGVLNDRYLLAGDHFGFISVFDFADPVNFVLEGEFPVGGQVTALDSLGPYVYVGLYDQQKLVVLRATERRDEPETASVSQERSEVMMAEGRDRND